VNATIRRSSTRYRRGRLSEARRDLDGRRWTRLRGQAAACNDPSGRRVRRDDVDHDLPVHDSRRRCATAAAADRAFEAERVARRQSVDDRQGHDGLQGEAGEPYRASFG